MYRTLTNITQQIDVRWLMFCMIILGALTALSIVSYKVLYQPKAIMAVCWYIDANHIKLEGLADYLYHATCGLVASTAGAKVYSAVAAKKVADAAIQVGRLVIRVMVYIARSALLGGLLGFLTFL